MIDDVRAAADAAVARLAGVVSLAEAQALETELLGKKGPFADFKTRLGGLATVDEKKAAGQAVNEALEDAPELINQDPYGRGWLVEVRPAQWPVASLLDAEKYLVVMTAQAEAEAAADRVVRHSQGSQHMAGLGVGARAGAAGAGAERSTGSPRLEAPPAQASSGSPRGRWPSSRSSRLRPRRVPAAVHAGRRPSPACRA